MKMDDTYCKLLQNLNVVKWELKNRNDPTLNLCIRCINDAILDVECLIAKLEQHQLIHSKADLDVCDCYD